LLKRQGHEEESVKIATDFLKNQQVSEEDIEAISNLILATKMEHVSQNKLEKIIRDADCAHIGSKNYLDILELLRKEWELTIDKKLSDTEWIEDNITFLATKHKFNTPEAAANWDKTKGKNLSQLLKTQKKLKQETTKFQQKKEELKFKS